MQPQSTTSHSLPPYDAQQPWRQQHHPAAYTSDHGATRGHAPPTHIASVRPVPLARVLALLCYSLPVVPSVWLLWRERHSRFVRFHAAQALVFCALIAAGQTTIWLLLLLAGGMVHNTLLASAIAVVVVLLFAALGLGALLLWFRLASDCLDGRTRRLPFAGNWADRLARLTSRRERH